MDFPTPPLKIVLRSELGLGSRTRGRRLTLRVEWCPPAAFAAPGPRSGPRRVAGSEREARPPGKRADIQSSPEGATANPKEPTCPFTICPRPGAGEMSAPHRVRARGVGKMPLALLL